MSANTPSLELRGLPAQKRSRETFDRILTEAGELLEESGFEAFTTNALASRSGIGVRAIYRYFPNKFALVCELARRVEEQWFDELDALDEDQADRPWPELWSEYLDRYIELTKQTPGGFAILRAMRSYPELRAVDVAMTQQFERNFATALRASHPLITARDANAIASVLLQSTVGVVDSALDASPAALKLRMSYLKRMHAALLDEVIKQAVI